jgi:biopolymer transport protein TolQ
LLIVNLILTAVAPPAGPSWWSIISSDNPISLAVLAMLVAASLFSWTIVFQKYGRLRKATDENGKFLRTFRKAPDVNVITAACEQYPTAPVVGVFDAGWAEVDRQLRGKGKLTNRTAIERCLQIGISQEISDLETSLNWLATIAAITPFIGLFGTVLGIIDAFQALSSAGSASLRAVGPGIAAALVATAAGLAAAIPAAIFYNYFGASVREIGARLEDFSLEFLNMVERAYEG